MEPKTPIYSMTGFGRGMARQGDVIATCDIRSVNHRYFDIHFRMPRLYAPLESKIRDIIASKISRGRIDLTLSVVAPPSDSGKIDVDVDMAKDYLKQFRKLQKGLNFSDEIGFSDIVDREGVLRFIENPQAPVKTHWPVIEKSVDKALASLVGMKKKEGTALKKDIGAHNQSLKLIAETLKNEIPEAVDQYKARFLARLEELSKSSKEIDPDRIVQEVALMISKTDVAEEVARLGTHLEQVAHFLKEGSPAGKRLDFLLQEVHREITTFGNKLQSREVSRLIVEAKSAAEKMREQIQNVE